jgi:hypothetical protein
MSMNRFLRKVTLPDWIAVIVLLALLVLGVSIYSQYGLSWDEPNQLTLGIQNYRFALNSDPSIFSNHDRWYGPLFEIFLIAAQSRSSLDQIYLSRHLLNFLAFFIGCIAFFLLARKFTRNGWLALLGLTCLVLSPRIFADAFYNSKDIPFLAAYSICLFSLLWFLDRPNIGRAALLGVFTAAMLAIRLPGLIIPALTGLGLLLEVLSHRAPWKRCLGAFVFYLVLTAVLLVFFWPALWPNPLAGFTEAFTFMSRFPHNGTMLYIGKYISDSPPPWHYALVWISVTTPLLYLAGILVGVVVLLARQGKALSKFRDQYSPERRNEAIVLAAALGPMLVVIFLGSGLYDGWRQLFFVYTPLLLIMLSGFQAFYEWVCRRLGKNISLALCGTLLVIGMIPIAAWMIQYHPYQNVYFNRLAGADMKTIQQRFPLDYWGLSYQRGLEEILRTDPGESINVFIESQQQALGLLPHVTVQRIHMTDNLSEADYFLGNYRDISRLPYPFSNEVFSVEIGNAKILSVFKLSPQERQ